MKNILLFFSAAACLAACQSNDKNANELSYEQRLKAVKDSSTFTTVEWLDSTSRVLQTEKEGKKVEVVYHFKNTGKHNLILADVSASCGCTTPDWPKRAIAPGEEDVIKAVFDSKGKQGTNHKQVFVRANTLPQNETTLSFSIEIIK